MFCRSWFCVRNSNIRTQRNLYFHMVAELVWTLQCFAGSPGQAERGQGGSVSVPPSTPSLEGGQRNDGGKGSGKNVSGMGLPGSEMPAWGAGGCCQMPGPSACYGAANGPGVIFGGPGFQNVPNFGQVPSNPFVAGQVPGSFQSIPNPVSRTCRMKFRVLLDFHRREV